MTAYIPISPTEFAVVDLEDVPIVLGYGWHPKRYTRTTYAQASIGGKKLAMHRLLCPDFSLIDHENRDGLDNRRANLRPTTKQGNALNTTARGMWKGVSYEKTRGKWEAWITIDGTKLTLGRFKTPEEAARVRDRAVWEWAGSQGFYNFPNEVKHGV